LYFSRRIIRGKIISTETLNKCGEDEKYVKRTGCVCVFVCVCEQRKGKDTCIRFLGNIKLLLGKQSVIVLTEFIRLRNAYCWGILWIFTYHKTAGIQ
jgi:hypothetical protein